MKVIVVCDLAMCGLIEFVVKMQSVFAIPHSAIFQKTIVFIFTAA
jgi:hypothetical protein